MRKTLNKMLAILLIAVMVTTLAPIESEAASRIYLEASVNNGATSLIINETDIYQVTEAGATKEIGFSEDLTFWLLTEDKMLYWYNYKCQGSSTIQFYLMDTNVISLVRNSDNRVTGYVASDEEKAIFTEEQVKIIVENNLSQGIDIPIKSTITPTPTSIPMYYEVSMRVNNGKMVLTINETENYEITGTGVTKDGGFSEDCTLWLLTTDQKLFWYSYEYQGSDFVKLHLLDTNVESLIRNSDDRVIGYVSNSVNKSVLSEEQIKLIIDNNISAEIDIPIKATPEPAATSTPRPTATATPEPTATLTPRPTATVTPEPTATLTPRPTATATPEPTATSTPRPTATATPEPTATSTPRPTATATPEPIETSTPRPTATPEPTATSTPRPTATATLEPTATLTPKPTATVTLKPIITSTPRPTATATLKPIVTSKPRPTATVTLKPTATPTPKVTYAARVNTQGIRKELYNSKEKRVDTFKLKKGTLTYHGWCVKNVKIAEFNVKGNVMVITKKGKLISINYKTMKKKTIKKSGIKSFRYNSKGMATYAIDKKNKKIKLSKY